MLVMSSYYSIAVHTHTTEGEGEGEGGGGVTYQDFQRSKHTL